MQMYIKNLKIKGRCEDANIEKTDNHLNFIIMQSIHVEIYVETNPSKGFFLLP